MVLFSLSHAADLDAVAKLCLVCKECVQIVLKLTQVLAQESPEQVPQVIPSHYFTGHWPPAQSSISTSWMPWSRDQSTCLRPDVYFV